MAELTMGIDLGGTKMAAVVLSKDNEVLSASTVPRPRTADAMLEEPIELARSLISGPVSAVGIGAAGLVRSADGVMVWGPNVEGEEVSFKAHFEASLGLPAFVDNDATLAGLAETRIGAAVGFRHVLMMTLGTGIGGGWMIDGSPYHGRGFAGEIGHMIVDVGGPACTCGQNGCWETFCSGRRLDQMARDLVAAQSGGLTAKLADGATPTGRHLVDAALEGDGDAIARLHEMASWMGLGIANLVAAFDPEIVVVGGGVSRAGDLLLVPARHAMVSVLEGAAHRPETPIVCAELGEQAGAIGAAMFARESM